MIFLNVSLLQGEINSGSSIVRKVLVPRVKTDFNWHMLQVQLDMLGDGANRVYCIHGYLVRPGSSCIHPNYTCLEINQHIYTGYYISDCTLSFTLY